VKLYLMLSIALYRRVALPVLAGATFIASKMPEASASPASKDDCLNPSCNSTKDMFKATMKMQSKRSAGKTIASTAPRVVGCPADKDALGRGTWELIHTICANYPASPEEEDKRRVREFFESLAALYPCPYCAEDFQKNIKASPPRLDSKEALSVWACQQHNIVNRKLGKPVVACDVAALNERYRSGHPSCWS